MPNTASVFLWVGELYNGIIAAWGQCFCPQASVFARGQCLHSQMAVVAIASDMTFGPEFQQSLCSRVTEKCKTD